MSRAQVENENSIQNCSLIYHFLKAICQILFSALFFIFSIFFNFPNYGVDEDDKSGEGGEERKGAKEARLEHLIFSLDNFAREKNLIFSLDTFVWEKTYPPHKEQLHPESGQRPFMRLRFDKK